jgi:energy-coupling factor transporter transmembrane protein EcfT
LDGTLRRLAAVFAEAHLREAIARRSGVIQRVHPRARLAAAALVLVSVSFASSLAELSLHALLVLTALPLARIRAREILQAGLVVALAFSTLMAAPATLNLVSGGRVVLPILQFQGTWHMGPYEIPAVVGLSVEGLSTAATFLLRTVTSATVVLCLTLSTHWTDLLASLRSFRLPALFLQTAGMAVRYVHLLLGHSEAVHLGKKARTICRGSLASDQMWVGSRIAAAWERSLHLVTDVTDAMTARGFTGDIHFAPGSACCPADWIFLVSVAGTCAAAHMA